MSHDVLARIIENLGDRVTGPMKFRVVLQPLMAIFFAYRDGQRDAKAGNPPYFWSILTHPEERMKLVSDGWKHVGKVFILAMVLDVVYQIIATHHVYPGEVVIVAILLAVVPYVLLRGLVTRWSRGSTGHRPS